jgi:hypothetical protein
MASKVHFNNMRSSSEVKYTSATMTSMAGMVSLIYGSRGVEQQGWYWKNMKVKEGQLGMWKGNGERWGNVIKKTQTVYINT